MNKFVKHFRLKRKVRLAASYGLAVLLTVTLMYSYEQFFNVSRSYVVGLFPVIVCSLWLGIGQGAVSLALLTVYFGLFLPEGPLRQVLLTALFLLEGAVVLWLFLDAQAIGPQTGADFTATRA